MRAGYGCNGGGGYAAIFMDGTVLPDGCQVAVYHDDTGATSQDHHFPVNLVCIVDNVTAGSHVFQVEYQNHACGSMMFGSGRGQSLVMVEELP